MCVASTAAFVEGLGGEVERSQGWEVGGYDEFEGEEELVSN